jgi:hypothetical protein
MNDDSRYKDAKGSHLGDLEVIDKGEALEDVGDRLIGLPPFEERVHRRWRGCEREGLDGSITSFGQTDRQIAGFVRFWVSFVETRLVITLMDSPFLTILGS